MDPENEHGEDANYIPKLMCRHSIVEERTFPAWSEGPESESVDVLISTLHWRACLRLGSCSCNDTPWNRRSLAFTQRPAEITRKLVRGHELSGDCVASVDRSLGKRLCEFGDKFSSPGDQLKLRRDIVIFQPKPRRKTLVIHQCLAFTGKPD